jgi:hypothetical protein
LYLAGFRGTSATTIYQLARLRCNRFFLVELVWVAELNYELLVGLVCKLLNLGEMGSVLKNSALLEILRSYYFASGW